MSLNRGWQATSQYLSIDHIALAKTCVYSQSNFPKRHLNAMVRSGDKRKGHRSQAGGKPTLHNRRWQKESNYGHLATTPIGSLLVVCLRTHWLKLPKSKPNLVCRAISTVGNSSLTPKASLIDLLSPSEYTLERHQHVEARCVILKTRKMLESSLSKLF